VKNEVSNINRNKIIFIKEIKMKNFCTWKTFSAVIAVILSTLIIFSSCGGNKETPDSGGRTSVGENKENNIESVQVSNSGNGLETTQPDNDSKQEVEWDN
jgi:hypothetical protein